MTKTILVDELTFNHMKLSYVGDFGHDFRNKERIEECFSSFTSVGGGSS